MDGEARPRWSTGAPPVGLSAAGRAAPEGEPAPGGRAAGGLRVRALWVLAAALVGWTVLVLTLGPTEVVARLGARNGYLVAFLVACVGGISSLTGASFLTTVAALAIGGLDPVKLGLAAGVGATISDAVFYYAGREGRRLMPDRLQPRLEALAAWTRRRPRWLAPVLVLAYTGGTPLPSDLLLATLGLARVPFRRILLPLLVGNSFFLSWFGYLASRGVRLFE